MADMGIVRSLLCYAWKGGKLTIKKWNGFGQRTAYKSPKGTRNDDGFIIKTVQSSGFDPSIYQKPYIYALKYRVLVHTCLNPFNFIVLLKGKQ